MDLARNWRRLRRLLTHDIWHLTEDDVAGRRFFLLRLLRIVVLAARGFTADSLHLRATSLTYYSLLSIVPVLALAFGVAKGFGLEAALEQALEERLAGQGEALDRALTFARSLLASTRGGLVAGIGVAVLLWSVVRLLTNIEASFNSIWGVAQGRNLARRVSDYAAMAVLAPLLLLASSSGAVFLAGRAEAALAELGILDPVGPLVRLAMELVPFVLSWLLLFLLYLAMPNTSVSWRAGLAAGITAGTLFQLLQYGYFQSVVNVARYNAIYGSFAALPLLLIWLHLSWLVVLVGAEVSFAVDNVGDYARERAAGQASHHERRLIALAAATAATRRFLAGEPPATASELAERLDVSTRVVHGALDTLVAAGVLAVVQPRGSGPRSDAYQPATDPDALTLGGVAAAFDAVPGETEAAEDRREGGALAGSEPLAAMAERWRRRVERIPDDEDPTLAALAREI